MPCFTYKSRRTEALPFSDDEMTPYHILLSPTRVRGKFTRPEIVPRDVYKLPAEPVDSNMAGSDHIRMITNINYNSFPAHAKQHVSLGFPLVALIADL